MLWNQGGPCVASAFGIIKIALLIRLQPHRKLVKMLRNLMVAVKTLVEIGFSVVIQVVENHDLISASYIDLAFVVFNAEGLE